MTDTMLEMLMPRTYSFRLKADADRFAEFYGSPPPYFLGMPGVVGRWHVHLHAYGPYKVWEFKTAN